MTGSSTNCATCDITSANKFLENNKCVSACAVTGNTAIGNPAVG